MNKIWIILITGIIIRIFLSLSTFHPDMEAFKLGGALFSSGKILNLYDYSSSLAVLNYPPAIYWYHGLFHFLFSGILGINQPTGLLLKLPYLVFDLLIAFVLFKLVDPKKALFILAVWMFNPISLYATYMMGQFDIIPTFFTILSLYLITKNRLKLAALALGGGIAFKLYPVFLLIPLIILGKTFWDKLRLTGWAILPCILSIIPYLSSENFRANALFTNQSSKSLYAGIPVSGGELILLFPGALILFYLFIGTKKLDRLYYWRIYLIPLLLFFIFTHYHPQWLIWITPLLIIGLVSNTRKVVLPVLLIFASWFGSLFFFDPSLTLGIFTPIFAPLQNVQSIWVYLNLHPDYNLSRSLIQTVFVAASAYLIYEYFPRKSNE